MAQIKRFGRHDFQNAAAECRGSGRVGGTAHDKKFFSAPAHQNIGFADHSSKSLCDQLKQPVSSRVPVQIIDFLKEIHVDHDEYEVAVIHLPNVAAACTLIISQHLPGLCRQD